MKYQPVTVWTIKLLVEPELCSLEREIGCKDVPFLNMILIRLFFLLEAIIVLVGGHTSQGILSHSFSLDAALLTSIMRLISVTDPIMPSNRVYRCCTMSNVVLQLSEKLAN